MLGQRWELFDFDNSQRWPANEIASHHSQRSQRWELTRFFGNTSKLMNEWNANQHTYAWLYALFSILRSIQNWEFFDLFLETEEVALNELLVLEPQRRSLHLKTFQFDSKVLRPQKIQYYLHFHCNNETFQKLKYFWSHENFWVTKNIEMILQKRLQFHGNFTNSTFNLAKTLR